MIRRVLIAFAVACTAEAATAEPVLVRTAEHDGFTRIVVDFTVRPSWQLGRTGNAYELRTDAADIDFDLRDIYRRIYSGRLVSIAPAGPGNLRLTIGCACRIETALRSNGGLIIDIRDGAPADDNPNEIALDSRRTAPPAARPSREARPVSPDRRMPPIELPTISGLTAHDVLSPLVAPPDLASAAALTAGLAEKIGRAAEQDLVALAPGVVPDSLAGDRVSESPAHQDTPDATANESGRDEVRPATGPNLRIVTEAERALTERGSITSVDPSLCARLEKVLDPKKWVHGGVGPAGVDFDRKRLVDIRGEANARGFRDLIRSYLYLTFGREALEALNAAPADLAHADLYAALAHIVESEPPGNDALTGLTSCPGHTGLWARLADPGAIAYRGDTTRPAAFADWPQHLRRALGPRLATAYLDAGDEDTARSIFRAIARVAAPDDPEFLLLAARFADPVDRTSPPTPAEETALEAVANARMPDSARALIELIEARIAENVPVGADLAMQAGALAFEQKGQPAAGELRSAEIRALTHDGRWKVALTRLDEGEPLPDAPDLLSDLVAAAARDATEADVMWLAARLEGRQGVSRTARLQLASRIADMGIAEMARTALNIGAAVPTEDERRLLARIALLEDKPSVADSYLAGLDTPVDQALRANAATIRDRQRAAAAAGFVPDPGGADHAPARDGADAAVGGPEVVARLAPLHVPVPSQGELAASRDLLEGAAALRDELDSLLSRPVPQ